MHSSVFLATTRHGLARAARGASDDWSIVRLLAGHDLRCLAADPFDAQVVYVGTQGQGVLRSNDRGMTWQPAGLHGQIIKALAVSPLEPDTLYAGTRPAQLFISRDGGAQWAELESFRRIPWRRLWFSPTEPPFTAYVQGIALSPTDPQTFLVGIELGAVVRSSDGGQTWSKHCRGALRDCHALRFHTTNGAWAYEGGGNGGGAAVSDDAGATWRRPQPGLDRHYGWAVAADPVQPEIWYVATSPSALKAHSPNNAQACIFRAVGDKPWQKLGGGLPQPLDYMPYALLTDPAASGNLYAGLSNGAIWHSADHGDTWRQLPFRLPGIQRALVLL